MTFKPILHIANVEEESVKSGNKYSKLLEQVGIEKKINTITLSIKLESEISEIKSSTERLEFINAVGLTESGLDKLSKAGYDLLNLITFFTSGVKESRAWTIKIGTRANIAAETISYNDFIKYNGEQNSKNFGKMRIEGKEYEVTDGDIKLIRFNV